MQALEAEEQELLLKLQNVRTRKAELQKTLDKQVESDRAKKRIESISKFINIQAEQSIKQLVSDILHDLLLRDYFPIDFAFNGNLLKVKFQNKTLLYEIWYDGMQESKTLPMELEDCSEDYYRTYNFTGGASSSSIRHIDYKKFSLFNSKQGLKFWRNRDSKLVFMLKLIDLR